MTDKKLDKKRCGAKTRSGEPCKSWAMPNGRCRMHGGSTPHGLASPHWKTGRHSKYLPTRLAERYEVAVTDPEILNLTAEIALVDSRIQDVLSRVDSGESGRLWNSLGSLRTQFMTALRLEDQAGQADAMREIINLIGRGRADFMAWSEVVDLLERRRRLVESEQKRRVAMHAMVKVEEAYGAMLQIADAVRDAAFEHVDDGSARQRLLSDVQAALDRFVAASVQSAAVGGD